MLYTENLLKKDMDRIFFTDQDKADPFNRLFILVPEPSFLPFLLWLISIPANQNEVNNL